MQLQSAVRSANGRWSRCGSNFDLRRAGVQICLRGDALPSKGELVLTKSPARFPGGAPDGAQAGISGANPRRTIVVIN